MHHPPFRKVLWLIPVAIAVHNAEEYSAMTEYADRHDWRVWAGPAGRRRWHIVIILVTIIPFFITAAAVRSPKNSRWFTLTLALPAAFSFNALTHLLQTIRHREYMPGTITGLAINVPLSIYIYRRAIREGYLPDSQLRLYCASVPGGDPE